MLPGTSVTLNRMGYGAMQLAGKDVWGPPRDIDAAVAVLREAVAVGINHIDTSDFYGPHVTNQIIRQALYPYPDGLTIVTKVGFRRPEDKSWQIARSKEELTSGVHDNLRNLGLEILDVVNLRAGAPHGPNEESIVEPLGVLVDLQHQGLIRHLGLSNITRQQFEEARALAEIVCVQNQYNLAIEQTTRSSTSSPERTLPSRRSSRWVASRLYNRTRWLQLRIRWKPLRCKWHSPGCCNVRLTSCSFVEPRPSNICARTSKPRRCDFLRRRWPS